MPPLARATLGRDANLPDFAAAAGSVHDTDLRGFVIFALVARDFLSALFQQLPASQVVSILSVLLIDGALMIGFAHGANLLRSVHRFPEALYRLSMARLLGLGAVPAAALVDASPLAAAFAMLAVHLSTPSFSSFGCDRPSPGWCRNPDGWRRSAHAGPAERELSAAAGLQHHRAPDLDPRGRCLGGSAGGRAFCQHAHADPPHHPVRNACRPGRLVRSCTFDRQPGPERRAAHGAAGAVGHSGRGDRSGCWRDVVLGQTFFEFWTHHKFTFDTPLFLWLTANAAVLGFSTAIEVFLLSTNRHTIYALVFFVTTGLALAVGAALLPVAGLAALPMVATLFSLVPIAYCLLWLRRTVFT